MVVFRWIACSIPFAKTGFFCDDDEIRYPHREDTISSHLMTVIFGIISIILFLSTEYSLVRHLSRKSKRVHRESDKLLHPAIENFFYLISMIICGNLATSAIINIGKRTMSRPRPNFISVCQPNLTALCPPGESHKFVEDYECHGEFSEEQYFSFPSGHASHAVFLGIFLIMYIQKRCKFPDPVRSLIQLILASFVCFICTSRVRDFKHRLSDVGGGVLVGTAMGLFFITHVANFFRHARYQTTDQGAEKGYHCIENGQTSTDIDNFLPKVNISRSVSDYGSLVSE
ncbi:hypothetical protein FO519_007517 [Halicephalobus sp. NKZ332]|nr:hypothetical protein FO519_007517 [Halicephalobus sp. NKZ332]